MTTKSNQILQLAESKFELSDSERLLLLQVIDGKVAGYTNSNGDVNNQLNVDECLQDCTIRADFIVWLCTNAEIPPLLHQKGITLIGAKILGMLDLRFVSIDFPLIFHQCVFTEAIKLDWAKIFFLNLRGSYISSSRFPASGEMVSLSAKGLSVENDVFLSDQFNTNGTVMFSGATIGGDIVCNNSKFDNPGNVALIIENTNIRGKVFLGEKFEAFGHVSLYGSTIDGDLICKSGKFNHPEGTALSTQSANIHGSVFLNDDFIANGEVRLVDTTIGGTLDCKNSILNNPKGYTLNAQHIDIKGPIFFCDRFKSIGEISLIGAKIGGALKCNGGIFDNLKGTALCAPEADINGSVLLSDNCQVNGKVELSETTVSGDLSCTKSTFNNPKSYTLKAQGANIKGSVLLCNDFTSIGGVWLARATIHEDLNCSRSQFSNNSKDYALNAEGIDIKGYVALFNTSATGQISISGAKIGGNLDCHNSIFKNPRKHTLTAESAMVQGSILLNDGFKNTGKISLLGITIGRYLDCSAGTFNNPGGDALNAQGADIKGSVLLRNGFSSFGQVSLPRATIGGDLECRSSQFFNPDSYAILAQGVVVKGCVFLCEKLIIDGTLMFVGATIESALVLDIEELPSSSNISIFNFKINHDISIIWWLLIRTYYVWAVSLWVWKCVVLSAYLKLNIFKNFILDLESSNVYTLDDREDSWPQPGKLNLNGFSYEKIASGSPIGSKQRLKWIRLQYPKEVYKSGKFSPQPYKQLANALQANGHKKAARDVLIGKNDDERRYGELNNIEKIWNWFLGITIAHGYRPHRAFWISIGIIIFGVLPFHQGYKNRLIEPSELEAYTISQESEKNTDQPNSAYPNLAYPEFFPLLYSLDVFLPIIDFHQESYWIPKASRGDIVHFENPTFFLKITNGGLLLAYFWLHIILGWIFTSLWVAGFTGLVRNVDD